MSCERIGLCWFAECDQCGHRQIFKGPALPRSYAHMIFKLRGIGWRVSPDFKSVICPDCRTESVLPLDIPREAKSKVFRTTRTKKGSEK